MTERGTLTAPSLMGMNSFGARLVTIALLGALYLSTLSDQRGVHSPQLLLLALVVVSAGIVGTLLVRTDPMPAALASVVAATGPIGCLLTGIAIQGPLGNPNQFNVQGAGVAICAFLCVRGRPAIAWCGFSAMAAVIVSWSVLTDQGVYGVGLVAPNVAVLGMATLFAIVVRPAAASIRRLRQTSISQAETMAAAEARLVERDRQLGELRRVAWPTLLRIAGGEPLSTAQAAEIRLTEAQLRDSVRARSLSVSSVTDAARIARSRGVAVVMFDDGGADEASDAARQSFCRLAADSLIDAHDGSVTVRIHPPGREALGSIVAIGGDGNARRIDVDPTGNHHELQFQS